MDIKEVLTFDFSEYDNIEVWVNGEDMFRNDLYLHMDDSYYIEDTSTDTWYSIEPRYHYAPIQLLFDEGYTVKFYIIEDREFVEELREMFYEEF